MLRFLRSLLGRPRDDESAPDEPPISERRAPPATCRSRSDLELAMGTVCTVVGTYAIRPFYNQKGVKFREWPVAVLDDDTEVLLESFWDEGDRHPAETIARFEGRRVSARGTLHAQPPGSVANIAVPCLSPVEQLDEADEV